MILKRFYHEGLAQASYLIGCPGAGEACVIDPNRDVEPYLAEAAKEGLRITAVTETHIHADYVSGSRELAELTGAQMYLSDEGDADWKYGFADQANVTLVRDGDEIRVGGVRLEVRRTPGHTPEHISFLLTDEGTSPVVQGAFTGDFVFVGDVGRPDLLENAAGMVGTMEPGARRLYGSIQRFLNLPDHLMIWPAHGAGSACGKSLGGVPVTSLGYEKACNWAFQISDEDAFVREVLSGQPEPPKYFAEMKRINKVGPSILNGIKVPARHLDGSRIPSLIGSGAVVLDARPSSDFRQAHIPGTLHVPLNKGFANWAGWFVSYDVDIWLIAETEADALQATRELALIGLDRVKGWYGADALTEFESAGGKLQHIQTTTFEHLHDEFVLDIRSKNEWNAGHVPGATHIALGLLSEGAPSLPRYKAIAVHCQAGGRSPIAMSLLQNLGVTNIIEVVDGYAGYQRWRSPELAGR